MFIEVGQHCVSQINQNSNRELFPMARCTFYTQRFHFWFWGWRCWGSSGRGSFPDVTFELSHLELWNSDLSVQWEQTIAVGKMNIACSLFSWHAHKKSKSSEELHNVNQSFPPSDMLLLWVRVLCICGINDLLRGAGGKWKPSTQLFVYIFQRGIGYIRCGSLVIGRAWMSEASRCLCLLLWQRHQSDFAPSPA